MLPRRSCVTDCARISLVFETADGLLRALKFVLARASTFKNRIAHPTEDGYRDCMLTVEVAGHVCEVQLHLAQARAHRRPSRPRRARRRPRRPAPCR